jgi:hypothetical protein
MLSSVAGIENNDRMKSGRASMIGQLDVVTRAIASVRTALLAVGSTATLTPRSNASMSGVYYFHSATGNNTNDCRPTANACKAIAKAMSQTYAPGAKLLFAGSFVGNVTLTPKSVPAIIFDFKK